MRKGCPSASGGGAGAMPRRSLQASRLPFHALCIPLVLAATAGCEGLIGDQPASTDGPAKAALLEPTLPRLTEKQYRNALIDLFGKGLPEVAVQPDTNPFLFTSIGATTDPLSELGVQHLEEAADLLTHLVLDDPT